MLMGHGLNYNSQACWTWITLSIMCPYEMQKKKKNGEHSGNFILKIH